MLFRSIERSPRLAEAHYGLEATLLERGDTQNANTCFHNALRHKPDFAKAHNALGCACLVRGERAQAQAAFQHALNLDPDNGMARHLLASITGANPEQAPEQYVTQLFDGFAEDFDAKLRQLAYNTPERLLALLTQHAPPASRPWTLLDLGCGTGLVGVQFAPHVKHLVGVDLSAKMLAKIGRAHV